MAQMTVMAGERGVSRLSERVAAEVRALRGRHSISQSRLGELLGLSQPQVSARLRGRVEFSLSEIEKLAEAFDLDPGDLLGYANPVPSRPTPRVLPGSNGRMDVTSQERFRRSAGRHVAARHRRKLRLLTAPVVTHLTPVTCGM